MRTRVGLEDTVTGMLINNIDECNYTSGLARRMAKEILNYLAEEENLIIPHVSKRSELLISSHEIWTVAREDDHETFCKWLDNKRQ